MMHEKRSRCGLAAGIWLPAMFVLAYATACGSDPMDGGDLSLPYEGIWTGTSDISDVPLSFTVAKNTVSQFSFSAAFSSCSSTFTSLPKAVIANQKFDFGLSNKGVSTHVSGTFASDTQATGSFGTFSLNLTCGTSFVSGSSSGEPWHASKP